ncbi:ATP-binding protein [Streptomyces sp. ISL-43]|uniref:tetratricopeptide repeat protein n=1 Tax=Streptomyces sp. ISL-43 TaxID=2819183 RepID=UPI001BE6A35A|nr:tetratricopeptide repeat protein [Streptomyces sp. ISL-43]MBT2446115.1 ATP-binding protein [Streptomyces sp. ISL-43]
MTAEQRARAEGDARITQIAVAGDYVAHAPGAGPPPPASPGLPAPPAALVGRDRSVKELTDLLDEGGAPVTVVAGLPGVGKSALAVATAHRVLERGWFEDRVFFLQLRGYAPNGAVSGPQAVREMLRYLGIRDADVPPSPDGQVALYRARLAALARDGRRVLIVADDAGSVSQAQDLVPPDGTHRLLVTSRHQLLAPGFTPRLLGLDELAAEPAAELLAGALLRTWPEDPRPAREPEALARIAEHCGRLPLALTVAGALLAGDPGLAAGELAGELAQARTRLEKLHVDGDVPVGVRVAFDLSYARLPVDQARIFRLLTVVPGPDCSTRYAHMVTRANEVEPEDLEVAWAALRRELAALVRASLLTEQPVGSGRWRMHDLVRLYALERAKEYADEDGREALIDEFLEMLVTVAEVVQQTLGVKRWEGGLASLFSVEQALEWFEGERAMLVNSVGFAADSGRVETALQLVDRIGAVLQVYGYEQDMIVVMRDGLELARRYRHLMVSAALCNLSTALISARHMEEATGHLAEALSLSRETGDLYGQGRAMTLLGSAYRHMNRFEEARAAHEEALVVFRELGMRSEEGMALACLGETLGLLGRLTESVSVLREAVAVMREIGDRHQEAALSEDLGFVLWRTGSREESLAVREKARAVMIELGNRVAAADALLGLGDSLFGAEPAEEALTHYQEALALYEQAGKTKGTGIALGRLGLCHQVAGRLGESLDALQRSCSLLAGTGDRGNEAMALSGLAVTLARLGRDAEAADALDRAADLYELVGDAETAAVSRTVAAQARRPPPEATPPRRRRERFRR